MAAGSTRQRSKSDCLPGNVWVREESQTLRPSARKVALGTTESIAPAPKSSGSSTAEPPAGSSVITGTFLNGQRTRRLLSSDRWLASPNLVPARTGRVRLCQADPNGPMLIALLEVLEGEPRCFRASQSAAEQNRQDSVVSLAANGVPIGTPQQGLACSAVSQLPRRTPRRLAPFTRRMLAASSGLSKPTSAAS